MTFKSLTFQSTLFFAKDRKIPAKETPAMSNTSGDSLAEDQVRLGNNLSAEDLAVLAKRRRNKRDHLPGLLERCDVQMTVVGSSGT